ncbi:MAG: hypothetical protein KA035_04020 [Candidatus Levybacteria bacterium]|nr:hypothetical protein [Candidatus Levybacteria bacterium]
MVDSSADNPNPHRPKNLFDIKREPFTPRSLSEPDPNYAHQSQKFELPYVYTNLTAYENGPDLWDSQSQLRQKKFTGQFLPSLEAHYDSLSPTGKDLVDNWAKQIEKLIKIPGNKLNTVLSGEEKSDLELPIVIMPPKGNGHYNGGGIEAADLTPETKKAADIFIKALMPELGIGLESNWKDAKQKIEKLQEAGVKIQTSVFGYTLPTIIPGITCDYGLTTNNYKYTDLQIEFSAAYKLDPWENYNP